MLREHNLTVRRIMMEQMGGWERFVSSFGQLLDSDSDGAGQPRRLFQLADPLDGEEPVVLVQLTCPSTTHEYYLRVPPSMPTFAEAVAWTFSRDVQSYRPAVET